MITESHLGLNSIMSARHTKCHFVFPSTVPCFWGCLPLLPPDIYQGRGWSSTETGILVTWGVFVILGLFLSNKCKD